MDGQLIASTKGGRANGMGHPCSGGCGFDEDGAVSACHIQQRGERRCRFLQVQYACARAAKIHRVGACAHGSSYRANDRAGIDIEAAGKGVGTGEGQGAGARLGEAAVGDDPADRQRVRRGSNRAGAGVQINRPGAQTEIRRAFEREISTP
ncbi:MAG: hypothetical protein WCO97_07595, partial [bacterium]